RSPRTPATPDARVVSFRAPSSTAIYPLSLHDALPISDEAVVVGEELLRHCRHIVEQAVRPQRRIEHVAGLQERRRLLEEAAVLRSEEHTSELQSPCNLVCRLLLEKKNQDKFESVHALQ